VADRFKCGQAHDGSATSGPNDWLAKKFDEMHDMYQGAQHKNDFQVRGYQKGKSLPNLTDYGIELMGSRGGYEAYKMADCEWERCSQNQGYRTRDG
jgi:hypothetical protein